PRKMWDKMASCPTNFHCFRASLSDMNDSSENPWVRTLPACRSAETTRCDGNGHLRTTARWKRAYPGFFIVSGRRKATWMTPLRYGGAYLSRPCLIFQQFPV